MKKGIFCVLICMLMMVSTIVPISGTTVSEKTSQPLAIGSILYVGGSGSNNYTKIQDAINDSNNGDTIYVFDDASPYYEDIVVNKSISLIGEDMNTTILQNHTGERAVVTLVADGVTFTGFFVQQYSSNNMNGIDVYSNNNTIQGNIIYSSENTGISINSFYTTVVYNRVIHAWEGIYVSGLYNNISYNYVTNTSNGLYLSAAYNNVILGNLCIDNYANGIWMGGAYFNTIMYNTLSESTLYAGLTTWLSYNNLIKLNTFSDNNKGLQILDGGDNTIVQNNFINNSVNADFRRSPRTETINFFVLTFIQATSHNKTFSYKMLSNNTWDENYWDDLNLVPYVIHGRVDILPRLAGHLEHLFRHWDFIFAIVSENYDYHPAQSPYGISGMR
jgi:parallel beta-helix repeat protein